MSASVGSTKLTARKPNNAVRMSAAMRSSGLLLRKMTNKTGALQMSIMTLRISSESMSIAEK